MLGRYDALEIEKVLRSVPMSSPCPQVSEREKWKSISEMLESSRLSKIISEAEEFSQTPIPALPATAFLDYKRTGQRERYNQPREQRRKMLSALVIAECLEGRGRFLDPVLDLIWAICEESTWATSAHQTELTDINMPVIDIHVAMTALELSEAHFILGSQLDPRLGRRIRDELDRRCFTPFLARNDFKWLHPSGQRRANNWTAVCNSGVVGAGLYMEQDPARLAAIIERAALSLDEYLSCFDECGGSSEGPGYWDFGFGYYVVLANLIEQRTDGRINFLAEDIIRSIAAYPLRVRLGPNRHVNFSDCQASVHYSYPLLVFLARRFDLPDLIALANERPGRIRRDNLTWSLRLLLWQAPPGAPPQCVSNTHDWFGGMTWMIARFDPAESDSLVLAAKGGDNAEMHNHNDVGTFIVHCHGESLIADIGRGRYTQAYFGSQRYEHLATSSLGHSVPSPNGCQQLAGERYRAVLLGHEVTAQRSTLNLELKDAYPSDAGLLSLQRRLTLFRDSNAGRVQVEDSVRFQSDAGMLESALITLADVEVEADHVVIRGRRGALRIDFVTERVRARVETHRGVDLPKGPKDIRRVVFSLLEPAREGQILLDITPIKDVAAVSSQSLQHRIRKKACAALHPSPGWPVSLP